MSWRLALMMGYYAAAASGLGWLVGYITSGAGVLQRPLPSRYTPYTVTVSGVLVFSLAMQAIDVEWSRQPGVVVFLFLILPALAGTYAGERHAWATGLASLEAEAFREELNQLRATNKKLRGRLKRIRTRLDTVDGV
jgi:hypothetical protein